MFQEETKMLIAMLTALALQAQSDAMPVRWLTDYKEAAARAQKLGLPLVIDAGREA